MGHLGLLIFERNDPKNVISYGFRVFRLFWGRRQAPVENISRICRRELAMRAFLPSLTGPLAKRPRAQIWAAREHVKVNKITPTINIL